MTRLDPVDRREQVADRRLLGCSAVAHAQNFVTWRQRLSQRLARHCHNVESDPTCRVGADAHPAHRRGDDSVIQSGINADAVDSPAHGLRGQDIRRGITDDRHAHRRLPAATCDDPDPSSSAGTRRPTSARRLATQRHDQTFTIRNNERGDTARSSRHRAELGRDFRASQQLRGATLAANTTCTVHGPLSTRRPPDPYTRASRSTPAMPFRHRPASSIASPAARLRADARLQPQPGDPQPRRPLLAAANRQRRRHDQQPGRRDGQSDPFRVQLLAPRVHSHGRNVRDRRRRHCSGRQLHGNGDLHAVRGRSSKRFADHPAQRTARARTPSR